MQMLPEIYTMVLWGDIQWVDCGWIFVWCTCTDKHLCIWIARKGGVAKKVDVPFWSHVLPPKISGDGSKVFVLIDSSIQVFSVQTGELVGKVGLDSELGLGGEGWPHYDPLMVDGSRLWVHFGGSKIQGWDFGISGSAPVLLSNVPPCGTHLELNIKQGGTKLYRIKDKVTGNDVFQLAGRYADPTDVQWDGQYLVAGYGTGEMVFLDFNHKLPQQGHVVCWPSQRFRGWACTNTD